MQAYITWTRRTLPSPAGFKFNRATTQGTINAFVSFEYNTLCLHALSPEWAIKNLYNVLYGFYHKNLECSYYPVLAPGENRHIEPGEKRQP